MSLTRRRFLTLTAAAVLATPARAEPIRWQGYAMGADCTLTLHAPPKQADVAIRAIRDLLSDIEHRFSLYDAASELSRLNQSGALTPPSSDMDKLLTLAGQVHTATQGRFDPTVQPLWHALATGHDATKARKAVGWARVQITPDRIALGPGQALTLNGIAQGYATDLATDRLRQLGLTRVLINLGEFSALGGPFQLGLSDPARGLFATRPLTNSAIATSSPGALHLSDTDTHILDPLGHGALWSTVTVEATSAALADAASTAFCLMSKPQIETAMHALPGLTRVTALPKQGTAQIFTI